MKKMNLLSMGLLLAVSFAVAASPKDTLVIQSSSDIPTLDPGGTYDVTSGGIVGNLYETLVSYKGNSLRQVEPQLASKWTISNGGKTFTFDLRKGVRFHNGDPMTCADAEYSLRRNILTNNSNSSNWFMAEPLLGTQSNGYEDKTINWSRISNAVKCNAQGQLVLTLAKMDPAFLAKLAYVGQSIVDKKYSASLGEWSGTENDWKAWIGKDLSESKLNQKPNGTGAYKLVRRDANLLLFQAFDGYWDKAPSIKNVSRQKVPELASRQMALLKGDADIIGGGGRTTDEAQFKGKPGITWIDGLPDISAAAIFMNEKISGDGLLGSGKLDGKGIPANFFSDINVRKGFSYAFNYDQYIQSVLKGKGAPRAMLLPETFIGYDEKAQTYAYDPAQAKAYLQKAWDGQVWKNGFTIVANYAANNTSAQLTMQMLKQNIEALNPKFHITLQPKQWSDIWSGSSRGEESMVLLSWSPDYADPDNFMYTYYASDGYYAPRSNFRDDKITQWLQAARNTVNISERLRYYSRAADRIYDMAPYINVPSSTGYAFFSSRLGGINNNTMNPISNSSMGVEWKDITKN